jgi:nitronate monooxygenase
MGTRFFASEESRGDPRAKAMIVAASGEETVRTSTVDVVRALDWPEMFTARVMRNDFVDAWHGAEPRLRAALESEMRRYQTAIEKADFSIAAVFAGEAIGLIERVLPAREIVVRTIAEAEAALARAAPR